MSRIAGHSVIRSILFILLVLVVGATGVLVGNVIRTRMPGRSAVVVNARVPESLLKVGNPFPDVALIDNEGASWSTKEILGSGGVVLFLDLECPPCVDAAVRWQRAVDEGLLSADQLLGITYHSRETIRGFESDHALQFPLLQDSTMTFRTRYDVDRFPLQVVVGASGRIRWTSYDSETPIDPVALQKQLGD